jgi:hypothetical protein
MGFYDRLGRFMSNLVTEQDLARAREDVSFRQQLMADNLEMLLEALKQLRQSDHASAESARQLREGVDLACKLADRLQEVVQVQDVDQGPEAA